MRRTAITHVGNELLLDARPIELAGFKLTARSAVPVGQPTPKQWIAAFQFAGAIEEASPYWIGDLLAYAEGREDWKEKFDQMLALTGLARQTVYNRTYVSRHVEEPERALAPTLGHAAAVASLPRQQQTKLLELAATEGLTVRQLEREVRASKRPKVLEGQASLEGMYRVVYAAPPWSSMSVAQLAGLPIKAHVAADAVLFMWTPAPQMLANPGAREVLEAWGFTYKTNGVWDRVLASFGSYLEITHEHLVIATRGDCQPDVPNPQPKSVFVERRQPDQVKKPDGIRRQWIERMYVRGPFLELFGTEAVDGWSVFGADPARWAREAEEEAAIA